MFLQVYKLFYKQNLLLFVFTRYFFWIERLKQVLLKIIVNGKQTIANKLLNKKFTT